MNGNIVIKMKMIRAVFMLTMLHLLLKPFQPHYITIQCDENVIIAFFLCLSYISCIINLI